MDDCLDDDFFCEIAHDGTIEGTTAGLDLSTRCHDGALQLQDGDLATELLRDCELANSPLICQDTFWIGAGCEPRCALEALALQIFEHHCGGSEMRRAARSGAEWWVQMKDPSAAGEEARQICFHWDKDERAHALHGFYVFPQLSTVTYLSDGGAPTVVLDRRPDSFSGDISSEPISEGAACFPERGRHLVFDGRKLHAAPLELARAPTSDRRVTFLVNCWLNHRPSGVREFPPIALDKMSPPDMAAALSLGGTLRRPTPVLAADDDAGEILEFPFSRVGTQHAVRLGTPSKGLDPRVGLVDLLASGFDASVVVVDHAPPAAEEATPPPAKKPRLSATPRKS